MCCSWAPLGTVRDKHGVPLTFNHANQTITLTMVVEPPFKPTAVRHAWQDAPQCMIFAEPGSMPVPPFNVTFAASARQGSVKSRLEIAETMFSVGPVKTVDVDTW